MTLFRKARMRDRREGKKGKYRAVRAREKTSESGGQSSKKRRKSSVRNAAVNERGGGYDSVA